MNKNWAQKCAKNKLNALQRSTRNKLLENRHINVKLCNKKFAVEKTQVDQNLNVNKIEKIKPTYQVELPKLQINKTDSCKPDLEIFHPLILHTFKNRFNRSVYKTKNLFLSTF